MAAETAGGGVESVAVPCRTNQLVLTTYTSTINHPTRPTYAFPDPALAASASAVVGLDTELAPLAVAAQQQFTTMMQIPGLPHRKTHHYSLRDSP
eukprot:gene3491-3950_t